MVGSDRNRRRQVTLQLHWSPLWDHGALNCKDSGHLQPACSYPLVTCFTCGGQGHLEIFCRRGGVLSQQSSFPSLAMEGGQRPPQQIQGPWRIPDCLVIPGAAPGPSRVRDRADDACIAYLSPGMSERVPFSVGLLLVVGSEVPLRSVIVPFL